jgi:hypothetical protein
VILGASIRGRETPAGRRGPDVIGSPLSRTGGGGHAEGEACAPLHSLRHRPRGRPGISMQKPDVRVPFRLLEPALEIVVVQGGVPRKGHAARIYTPFDLSSTEKFMDQ